MGGRKDKLSQTGRRKVGEQGKDEKRELPEGPTVAAKMKKMEKKNQEKVGVIVSEQTGHIVRRRSKRAGSAPEAGVKRSDKVDPFIS